MADPLNSSNPTLRIHLLIDLHPLAHLPNPTNYLTTILTSSKSLLLNSPFPSLSSFSLFFSSLSPTLSSSILRHVTAASFGPHQETLVELSETLWSLPGKIDRTQFGNPTPRASHVAGSLLQLKKIFAQEKQSETGAGDSSNFPITRSNLVILFSPISDLAKCVAEFMNEDEGGDIASNLLTNVDLSCNKFYGIFRNVNDAYLRRDIHCSWIDVKFGMKCDEEKVQECKSSSQLQCIKNGIRSLGWGFCSTDSIILGSSLIPFQLIYPLIGITSNYLKCIDNFKLIHTQLILDILDAGGKPLEGKCCDLELLCLNKSPAKMVAEDISNLNFRNSESEAIKLDSKIWNCFDGRIIKLHIKAVRRCNGYRNAYCSSDLFLVRGHSQESRINSKKCFSSFFADRVLEVISSETGESICSKSGPTWQLLLSFLCRNGYKALVSVSSEKGDNFMAMLEPFTIHLAILSFVNDDGLTMEKEYNVHKPITAHGEFCTTNASQFDKNRHRSKKNAYKDLTWISFHKAAFEFTPLALEEAYFASQLSISKKLKFLQCWMKQIKKFNNGPISRKEDVESCQRIQRRTDETVTGRDEDGEQPNPSCVPTEPCRMKVGAGFVSNSESSETFFNDLPKKIQDGIEFKGVDLQILAERLVNLSIYWLSQNNDTGSGNSIKGEASKAKPDDSPCNIVANVIKLLLKDPKELRDKAKTTGSPLSASNLDYISSSLENIVREHELQILFRMEILRSRIAESVGTSRKRNFVKQICGLLEIIQYLVEGGFHGNTSLYAYFEKTIKSRYHHVLGDVVNKIYERMDLLPFGDEELIPILLPNSEDSNHSWLDRDREEMNRNWESNTEEDDSSRTDVDCLQVDIYNDEKNARKAEEKGRKQRGWKILQRVWAPKQANNMPVKSDSVRKQSKRKERSKRKDVVCETPVLNMKYNDSDHRISVSKALFQDD